MALLPPYRVLNPWPLQPQMIAMRQPVEASYRGQEDEIDTTEEERTDVTAEVSAEELPPAGERLEGFRPQQGEERNESGYGEPTR